MSDDYDDDDDDDKSFEVEAESSRTRYQRYLQSAMEEVSSPDEWSELHWFSFDGG